MHTAAMSGIRSGAVSWKKYERVIFWCSALLNGKTFQPKQQIA